LYGAAGVAPGAPTVLIINQALPEWPVESDRRGKQIQNLLRHFSPKTLLIADADYKPRQVFDFDRVVVVGNHAVTPLSTVVLQDLVHAGRPVLWLGYGVQHLPVDMDEMMGFVAEFFAETTLPTAVEYKGQHLPAKLETYALIRLSRPTAEVLASYIGGSEPIPYIVRGGDFWYVNGLPNLDSDYPDPATDAPTLVFADALHDFFGTTTPTSRRAVIRLEDVSVHIDPRVLTETVNFLSSEGIPFALGLIPNQRFEDGSIVSLRDRPEFVAAVRYAQDSGATIVLHGYHHTFGSGEDYEFWDEKRNAPLKGETWDSYAAKVEDGIRILRDVGIEPRLWETPHYAASDLAYEVFAHYFSHAIENREPASWLPYPIAPDEFGQVLIGENIGYLHPEEGWTVDAQLERARLLQVVRDSWAVGFYHPANIPLSELKMLVSKLRDQNYTFIDLRSLPMEVRYDYEPNLTTRLMGSFQESEQRLGRALPDLPGSRLSVLAAFSMGIVLLFLIRLRQQWHPLAVPAISVTERSHLGPAWRPPLRWGIPVVLTVLVSILVATTGGFLREGNWGNPGNFRYVANSGGPEEIKDAPGDVAVMGDVPLSSPEPASVVSDDWELSIYYTVVESYHSGPPQEVRGCLAMDCQQSADLLGTYSSDFVQTVKDEGSGRITSGPHAGRYLNWSGATGYWLDTAPRDARGLVLKPYLSAAADPSIPFVTAFKILDCGVDVRNGAPIDLGVCEQLSSAEWIVRDRFEVNVVGKHVDLYIGEEDQPNFVANSPRAIHVTGATVSMSK
jgi:hypothetical protein